VSERVLVLAGGTGGAKLARGLLDVVGPDCLTVIANTGDDIEIYGAYVSPDPDLVAFWLADRIDARGWGLAGDTFHVMDGLRELGLEVWFNLGDRDLAIGIERARLLTSGRRLTDALEELTDRLGIPARIVPPCDEPIRTRVMARGEWVGLQEFLIREAAAGPVEEVEFHGARAARGTPEALAAIEQADAIVIGPSNPVISIGPILAVPGIREALRAASAPVVAVSPLVNGTVVKGPTAEFMRWAGWDLDAEGIAEAYADLLDGLVADEGSERLPVLRTDVLMDGPEARRRLAAETLSFARGLASAPSGNASAP
jgi:LPPG:FO 2-phospho-L-lactate transferase